VSDWDDFFGTIADAMQADFAERYPVPPDPEIPAPAGTLTLAAFERWLDELWRPGRWPAARESDEYAARAVLPPDPFCQAVLFAPEDGLRQAMRLEIIMQQGAVDPFTAEYLESPVQGPVPLRCELEPHPEGTWHRDDRTWFR
jgi:hypothetical protein